VISEGCFTAYTSISCTSATIQIIQTNRLLAFRVRFLVERAFLSDGSIRWEKKLPLASAQRFVAMMEGAMIETAANRRPVD